MCLNSWKDEKNEDDDERMKRQRINHVFLGTSMVYMSKTEVDYLQDVDMLMRKLRNM